MCHRQMDGAQIEAHSQPLAHERFEVHSLPLSPFALCSRVTKHLFSIPMPPGFRPIESPCSIEASPCSFQLASSRKAFHPFSVSYPFARLITFLLYKAYHILVARSPHQLDSAGQVSRFSWSKSLDSPNAFIPFPIHPPEYFRSFTPFSCISPFSLTSPRS